jgi:hypothetical protein
MGATVGSVDHNAVLKGAKRPTLRADQVFEKFHSPAHRKNLCGVRVLFKARLLEGPGCGFPFQIIALTAEPACESGFKQRPHVICGLLDHGSSEFDAVAHLARIK